MTGLKLMSGVVISAALLGVTLTMAQPPGRSDDDGPPPRGRRGGPNSGPSSDRARPPGDSLFATLDTNHDGELSDDEIRTASTALKVLDRNDNGTIDRAELQPRRGGEPGGRGMGKPRSDGPDGRSDGPRRGRGLGGPPPADPDGPPDGDKPPGARHGRPGIGHVLPPFARDELSLTDRQQKQIAELENEVKGKLESILTADQLNEFRGLLERGPGAPGEFGGPRGPGRRGPAGAGGRPGSNQDDDEAPQRRPRRPDNS